MNDTQKALFATCKKGSMLSVEVRAWPIQDTPLKQVFNMEE